MNKEIWVVISNKTAKLITCEDKYSNTGKTVYWNTQKEASQKIQDAGYEVEFYMSEENQDELVHADDVTNFSNYR